jgi:hypothetical protein
MRKRTRPENKDVVAARVALYRARGREAELERERLVDWESITGEHWASLLPKELLALQAWRYDRAVYYDLGVRVIGGIFRPRRYKFPRPEYRHPPIDRSGEPWAARLGGRRLGGFNGDRVLTDHLGGHRDGRGAIWNLITVLFFLSKGWGVPPTEGFVQGRQLSLGPGRAGGEQGTFDHGHARS